MIKNTNKEINHDVVVTRAKETDRGIRFSMDVNGVSINGCYWREGEKNGKDYCFVAFPSYKGSDEKYYNHAYVKLSDEDLKTIESMITKIINPE